MSGHGSLGGWQDIHRTADLIERANQLVGNIPLGDLSKKTAESVRQSSRAIAAAVSVLKQAAREQRAVTNLAAGLARMDPDKRAEHQLDDLRDRMDEQWYRRDAEADGAA